MTQVIRFVLLCLMLLASSQAFAGPLAAPGDLRLRHDLELLNDAGVINIPLTTWPISLGDVHNALNAVNALGLDDAHKSAYERVGRRLREWLDTGTPIFSLGFSGAVNPRTIRSFENTPREEAELSAKIDWTGERFAINLVLGYVSNPFDGDALRPDDTFVGVALGNWMLTAGWQDRWFGPGRDGSLILSSNARPTPGIALQRIVSAPFESKWLSWVGPWTLTSFVTMLDDERTINDALLFGLRGSLRPLPGLEIGITRTAQWCGDGRPCSLSAFGDLLVGNDNRGVNVAPEDEPGNQLGGWDIRWSLPAGIPVALYMQWIGEDGREAGGAIGNWLRQAGAEHWGEIGGLVHRSHIEVSDSSCHQGGFGFSAIQPNCAYAHGIYRTGYRYRKRSIGHAADGDSLSYSIGSTLVQSAGHTWNATLRYMEINREGAPNPRHTLSPTPQELIDVQLTHERETRIGRFYAGIAYSLLDDRASGRRDSDLAGFVRWSTR